MGFERRTDAGVQLGIEHVTRVAETAERADRVLTDLVTATPGHVLTLVLIYRQDTPDTHAACLGCLPCCFISGRLTDGRTVDERTDE